MPYARVCALLPVRPPSRPRGSVFLVGLPQWSSPQCVSTSQMPVNTDLRVKGDCDLQQYHNAYTQEIKARWHFLMVMAYL